MKEAATLAKATAASGIDQPEIQLDAMREINDKTVENNLDDSSEFDPTTSRESCSKYQ